MLFEERFANHYAAHHKLGIGIDRSPFVCKIEYYSRTFVFHRYGCRDRLRSDDHSVRLCCPYGHELCSFRLEFDRKIFSFLESVFPEEVSDDILRIGALSRCHYFTSFEVAESLYFGSRVVEDVEDTECIDGYDPYASVCFFVQFCREIRRDSGYVSLSVRYFRDHFIGSRYSVEFVIFKPFTVFRSAPHIDRSDTCRSCENIHVHIRLFSLLIVFSFLAASAERKRQHEHQHHRNDLYNFFHIIFPPESVFFRLCV